MGLDQINKDLLKAQADNRAIQSDYQFYLNPVNLEKELRARFNYSLPGEKTIIIVPQASSTN